MYGGFVRLLDDHIDTLSKAKFAYTADHVDTYFKQAEELEDRFIKARNEMLLIAGETLVNLIVRGPMILSFIDTRQLDERALFSDEENQIIREDYDRISKYRAEFLDVARVELGVHAVELPDITKSL